MGSVQSLDEDNISGWRQNGRNLTLQLLQEGVFSQRPHVYSEALDYVLDLLDPKIVPVQNEPKQMLEVVGMLLKQTKANQHKERLLGLVQTYKSCSDERIFYRLLRVVSQLLDPKEIREILLEFKGIHPDLIAKVRLVWPLRWNIDMRKEALLSSYWEGVPNFIWAELWWKTAIETDLEATNLQAPDTLHSYLLRQFAFNPTPYSYSIRVLYNLIEAKELSNWAVWRLLEYNQFVSFATYRDGLFEEIYREKHTRLNRFNISIDYSGLDKETNSVVDSLLEIMFDAMNIIMTKERDFSTAFSSHLKTLKKHLERPGLLSWYAYQCALTLLLYKMNLRRGIGTFKLERPWQLLLRDLQNFNEDLQILDEDKTRVYYLLRDKLVLEGRIIPNQIRLISGGSFVSITDILANAICNGFDYESSLKWIQEMLFETDILGSLVERCKDHLPNLLITLNGLRFVRTTSRVFINSSSMQEILEISRSTDNPRMLSGALVVLSSSKLLDLAEPDLILKLIRAGFNKVEFIKALFNLQSSTSINRNYEEVMKEVARTILESPNNYTFQITCLAAQFLA